MNYDAKPKNTLDFSLEDKITFHWCGKFQSPSEEWIHMTRELTDYEIFLVTHGTLYIADENKEYTVTKGEFLIMAPTKKQYGYRSSDCTFYWMHFALNLNEKYHPQSMEKEPAMDIAPATSVSEESSTVSMPFQASLENMERFVILIHQLQDSGRRYHHKPTSDLLCLGILLEINNQLQQRAAKKAKDFTSARAHLYTAILDYVFWNGAGDLRVSQLAGYFGYHEKYISTFFKEQAGISLKQYLLQEKMAHGKAQLMDTNKTITQIAYSLGYSDSHNFSNAFKKVTGTTPSEYRNSCLQVPKTP